jgi:hypothetical protein
MEFSNTADWKSALRCLRACRSLAAVPNLRPTCSRFEVLVCIFHRRADSLSQDRIALLRNARTWLSALYLGCGLPLRKMQVIEFAKSFPIVAHDLPVVRGCAATQPYQSGMTFWQPV